MITETKTIYKCDYCKKLYQIKCACGRHELSCTKNPENDRPCFHCQHLHKKETEIFVDRYDGEHSYALELLHCNKLNHFLYTPQIEQKKNWYELGEENNPMPKQCKIFDEEGGKNNPF